MKDDTVANDVVLTPMMKQFFRVEGKASRCDYAIQVRGFL